MGKIKIENLKIARDGLIGLDPEISKNAGIPIMLAQKIFPYIKGIGAIKKDHWNKIVDFDKYAERVFGLKRNDDCYMYLFDMNFVIKDDTMSGLIQRLTDVIDGCRKFHFEPLREDGWGSWEATSDDDDLGIDSEAEQENWDKLNYYLYELGIPL